jgi:hypothetical protein
MPDRPSDRQLAPWEAVLAQALQQDQPERTALEEMQAAQDWTTNTGHLLELSEAYWRLDVVPQIDEMIRQRVSPREFERYRQDPERPALLQALRAHEIGGRQIEDSLDAITAEPMTGLRSIAAGMHGRLGKEPPPMRGETRTWAERAPENAPEPIGEAARMLDSRAAELGRQVAERPQQWALEAWGVPPAEPGALREDWERRAGIVESYREAAGITDPAQAIGPAPSGQAQMREAFHASVIALELPDDQAMLRATGRGELEARVAAFDRAAALAPPDVQAEIGEREHAWRAAQDSACNARYAMDAEEAALAEAQAADAEQDLGRLAVADAARQEWAEAHAGTAEAARDAEGELRRRDQGGRIAQAGETAAAEPPLETDAEFMARLDGIVAAAEAGNAQPEAEAGQDQAQPEPEPEPYRAMSDAELDQHLERLVAETEGREWVPPETEARAEPEPQPRPASEAEFQEKLGRMVAESEGVEYVPPEPEPEPEPLPEPTGEADFREQLGRMVAEAEGREWVPPEPAPEPEPQPEPLSEAEFRAQLDQIVRDSQHGPAPDAGAQVKPEAAEAAMYAEISEDLAAIGEGIRELEAQMEAEDAARIEAQQEAMARPAVWQQPEIQAEAEAAAEAGQAEAGVDMEAEI